MPAALLPPPTQATTQSGNRSKRVTTLLARFAADDGLEIADHHRKRMRTDDAADDVVRVLDRCHPVSHRFVDGVAKRLGAAFDRTDFGTQQASC